MPTIKDALDIIGKLTVAEQESLKTMLLSPAFVKSLNIEDFVAKCAKLRENGLKSL